MPIFEIERNGQSFEADAPDINTALSGLTNYLAMQKPAPTAGPRPQQIKAPNGDIVEFPADMPHDKISEVMARHYGGPQSR
jgi:hypothetical protein